MCLFGYIFFVHLSLTQSSSIWPDSSSGVHKFLTFDTYIQANTITTSSLRNYDWVWGGKHLDNIHAYNQINPSFVVSFIFPYLLVHNSTETLQHWQKTQNSWILYQCDRKTPAWQGKLPNIPLDITNPNVIQWQIENYAKPAAQAGYDVIAADMFSLHEYGGACGVWESPGKWKQLYNISKKCHPKRDETCNIPSVKTSSHLTPGELDFAQKQIQWLNKFREGISSITTKKGKPMGLIPNFSITMQGLIWNDPLLQDVIVNVDGILDECGFTRCGHWREHEPLWSNSTLYALTAQEKGVGYHTIHECGKVGNITDPSLRQWIVGSYLMINNHFASLFLSNVQQYGSWMLNWAEFSVPIGTPTGWPVKLISGLWKRDFTNGTVLINPSEDHDVSFGLNASRCYADIYGNPITTRAASRFDVAPGSAKVFTYVSCRQIE